MAINSPTNVFAAFEMLLEELGVEIDLTNKAGASAFEGRDYDRAREALERAGHLTAFRDKVIALRAEWDTLAAVQVSSGEDEADHTARRSRGRLRRGMRTREEAYFESILTALVELNGSAKINDVLARVEQKMKGVLKPVDYESLASEPHHPRWRNTAQWARNTLVQRGLMKSGSPYGVWEISEAGRAYLSRSR